MQIVLFQQSAHLLPLQCGILLQRDRLEPLHPRVLLDAKFQPIRSEHQDDTAPGVLQAFLPGLRQ